MPAYNVSRSHVHIEIRTYECREKLVAFKNRLDFILTNARIVIHHREDPVAASFYMVVWTDATEHRGQPQLGPRIVTGSAETQKNRRTILSY